MQHTAPRADATPSASATDPGPPGATRVHRGPPDEALEFPGCRPVPLLRDRLADFEGRLEYWDSRTETAWIVAEPPGGTHESTSRRLPELARLIAAVRGAPIRSFGGVCLRLNDAAGRADRMMQPDETIYLDPRRAKLPGKALVVGDHDLPDVVLEVDQTTDVRRGKLPLYEAWGFPELWLLVPAAGATRRRPARGHDSPPGRRPLPRRPRERRASGMDRAGDPRGADRAADNARHLPRPGAGRPRARRALGHPPGG